MILCLQNNQILFYHSKMIINRLNKKCNYYEYVGSSGGEVPGLVALGLSKL